MLGCIPILVIAIGIVSYILIRANRGRSTSKSKFMLENQLCRLSLFITVATAPEWTQVASFPSSQLESTEATRTYENSSEMSEKST